MNKPALLCRHGSADDYCPLCDDEAGAALYERLALTGGDDLFPEPTVFLVDADEDPREADHWYSERLEALAWKEG